MNNSESDHTEPGQDAAEELAAKSAAGQEQVLESEEAAAAHADSEPAPEPASEPSAEQADDGIELAKVKDQLLRTVAELDNVRRRAQRDVENAHKFAVEKLLGDLLPVADSLEKAEEAAQSTDNAASMAEGIGLSLKLFVGILEKAGVAIIDPLGEPFDPQLHEAMAMVPNPDAEPNTVMDVMQRGYTLNGRLVRAAKVIVVKGE
ncbi:MAG: nucleotide exchange factor GrpE [Proteobacteria bacterium]|nr:nucleotide exchange factor GrpE [Pseudomonadota bacterium]